MLAKTALVLLLVSLAGACAHQTPPAERREARREAAAEARWERPPGQWVRLGERWVDGAHDRDVIPVGAREGRYRRIMVVVEHSALEMYDLTVRFGDGTEFSPRTRHVFGADTRSHVIDLPGDRRVISSVEFRYGNLPGGGRAQAELWAE
ncbi:MAG: hypothetical protein QOI66_4848 [Myxococcales bacterium]|jgi:hypothetical protein|nr:hypothetical protein [Myxococcales bacterium]